MRPGWSRAAHAATRANELGYQVGVGASPALVADGEGISLIELIALRIDHPYEYDVGLIAGRRMITLLRRGLA